MLELAIDATGALNNVVMMLADQISTIDEIPLETFD